MTFLISLIVIVIFISVLCMMLLSALLQIIKLDDKNAHNLYQQGIIQKNKEKEKK